MYRFNNFRTLFANTSTANTSTANTSTANTSTADTTARKKTAARTVRGAFAALAAAALTLGVLSTAAPDARADAEGGPYRMTYTIAARGSVSYNITYRGGELAQALAVAYGDDIDMEVYDARGNLIEWDRLPDDEPYCSWVPRWTQTYRIVIKNCESYAVPVVVRTN